MHDMMDILVQQSPITGDWILYVDGRSVETFRHERNARFYMELGIDYIKSGGYQVKSTASDRLLIWEEIVRIKYDRGEVV